MKIITGATFTITLEPDDRVAFYVPKGYVLEAQETTESGETIYAFRPGQ